MELAMDMVMCHVSIYPSIHQIIGEQILIKIILSSPTTQKKEKDTVVVIQCYCMYNV